MHWNHANVHPNIAFFSNQNEVFSLGLGVLRLISEYNDIGRFWHKASLLPTACQIISNHKRTAAQKY
jgi:hypothetical protein